MSEVVQAASSTGAQPSRTAGASTVARVLVVDSDPAALAAIEDVLRHDGYFTASAFDAAAALDIATRLGPFELLITELHTTPVNGVELASALRAREPELQVLYVTTCGDALFAQDIPHSADNDVLEKPFSEDELMDAVSTLLDWHRPPRSRR
jgi:two-component system OmpR family response regulator